MSRPSDIPTWATGGSAIKVQPDAEKVAVGWSNNNKVQAGFLNWLLNLYGVWITYLVSSVTSMFGGTLTFKKIQVDGVGQQATTVGDGNITASGTVAGLIVAATSNLTFGAVASGPRVKATGTALVAGDFALGVGWGNTATISVAAGSNDMTGSVTVTCQGAGIAAAPRIILTYKNGTWGANGAVQIVNHVDNSESSNSGPLYPVVIKSSTTAPQWFMVGTPVTANNYTFNWITVGI